jgi:hypothetical protein
MTLKERIENNLTLYTLSLLLAGFVAGLGTYKFFLEVLGPKASITSECIGESWKAPARQAAWLPPNECPAYPMEMKLTSPGNNAVVSMKSRETWFDTPVVVTSTRPLPEKSNIGVVFKPTESPNYYVFFPGFTEAGSRSTFRYDSFIDLPFALKPDMAIELRALVIDNKQKLGSVFSTIDQIRASDSSVFLSEPVQLRVK